VEEKLTFCFSADHLGYLMLFRVYGSQRAADRCRVVLEGVGLDITTIQTGFEDHPYKIEETMQNRLTICI